jgi:hypothetical protein
VDLAPFSKSYINSKRLTNKRIYDQNREELVKRLDNYIKPFYWGKFDE